MASDERRDDRDFALPGLTGEGEFRPGLQGFRKVQVIMTVTMVLLGSLVAFSWWSSRELTTATRELANTYALRQHQAEIHAAIGDAEFLQWTILLARLGSPAVASPTLPVPDSQEAAAVHEAFRIALDRARAALDSATALTARDPSLGEQRTLVAELAPVVEARLAQFERVVAVATSGEPPSATWVLLASQGVGLTNEVHAGLELLTEATQPQIQARLDHAEQTAGTTRVAALAGVLLAILLLLLLAASVREDLAKRQRREAALRRSQREMREFLRGMPLGVVVVDARGRIVYTNPLGDDLLPTPFRGATASKVLVEELPLFVRGADTPYPSERFPVLRALRGASASEEDIDLDLGDRRIPLHVSAEPVRDASGEVAFVVSTFVDMQPRLEARAQLVRAKQMAEAASRAKSDFLARMSHELRTPLNSVIGFTNVLLKNRHGRLASSDLFYLERIRYGGCHLLDVINGILDLARIEAGRVEIQLEAVRLDELVSETMAGFEGQLVDRPVGIELKLPEGPLDTVTDPLKLRQILINLVGNAVKFTEEGTVTVTLEADPATGGPRRLAVRDTGPGIPDDRIDAIFHAFEQVDNGTDRRHDGTGLGLTITKALCEELGFRLEVASVVGEGSTFTVHFPDRMPELPASSDDGSEGARAPEAAAAVTSARPPDDERADPPVNGARGASLPAPGASGTSPGEGPLVLVVDDEADARFLVVEGLREAGCRTLAAGSVAEALEMARRERPDLVTLDLLLNDERGEDFLEALRADPALQETPVLVVSVAADEVRGRLPGASQVLGKPLDRAAIEGALLRHVGVTNGRH